MIFILPTWSTCFKLSNDFRFSNILPMAMNPLLFYYYYYLLNNINHLIQYAGTDIKYPIIEMINYIIGNLLL